MDFGTSVMSGVILMYIQSWLKRFDWYKAFVTRFPMADKYVHRMVAALGSFFMVLGVTYTVTGDRSVGWMLQLQIPNQENLVHAIWTFLVSFFSQQVAYDATRRPPSMPHDQPASTVKV